MATQRNFTMPAFAAVPFRAFLMSSSYIAGRRTNEMAIRVALGARKRNIARLVIGDGVRLSLLGIAAGLVGTIILTRLMRSLLFEVSPTGPATLFSVALLLLCVAWAGVIFLQGARL